MGVSQDELKTHLRSFSVGNYLIFYFPIENGIDVVRVLQGAGDIDSFLFP
jgi:toxin ParE1/3/4